MANGSFDVVIVGGGVSGLTAAHTLKKNLPDAKLIVVEANDRLGGRLCPAVLNGPNGTTGEFDLGGHWISRTQPHVSMLVKELGLEVVPQDVQGEKITILANSERRQHEQSATGGMPFLAAVDTLLTIRQLGKCQQLISIDDLTKCPNAKKFDSETLETFKQRTMMTKDGKAAFDMAIRSFLGVETPQISLLYFLHFCRIVGGIEQIVMSSKQGHAQEKHIKGGAYQIINKLADRVGRENIRLNSVVTSITQTDDDVRVSLEDGSEFVAKYVLVSIPVHLKARIHYSPPLPKDQTALLERMPMGSLVKFMATYERKFWKDRGLSGEANYFPYEQNSMWVVDFTFDGSTADGVPALVGFISGNKTYSFSKLSEKEQKELIINSLVRFFGEEAARTIDFVAKDWSKEPYTGGCPVGIAAPGTYTLYDEENLRRPFGRIHWAGTETATLWKAYIDGAVQSGWRAAYEILKCLQDNFLAPATFTEQDLVLKEDLRQTSFLSSFRRKEKQTQVQLN